MKKLRFLSLSAVIIALLASFMVFPVSAADLSATPTSAAVQVNSAPVAFEAYNINGNNYFKLRDVAFALMKTGAHFSVTFDATANAVWISSLEYYVPAGGELTSSGNKKAVKALSSSSVVYYNGKQIKITAYNINGNNYFKLRDIASVINFSVVYNSNTNTINIDTEREYYFSEIMNLVPNAVEAKKKLYYNNTDTGNITITSYDSSYYSIEAFNISSDNDYAKLDKIISAFVTDSKSVLELAKASILTGRQDIDIDGKNITCVMVGQTLTIDFKW